MLAFRGGGAEETVVDGETGLFFDEQSVEAIIGVVRRLEAATIDPGACRTHAEQFSEECFDARMRAHVDDVLNGG